MGIAVGLFSGGLDSWLASLLIKKLGFEVHALQICSPFFGKSGAEFEAMRLEMENRGIKLVRLEVGPDYLDMLLNPKHGYGSCVNPCIDCHIHMLRMAKAYMLKIGGAFVYTGEVLNQRPMSQKKPVLKLIERESGLEGYLLRPLSAHFLDETVPEKQGLVKRELLMDIQGRNRERQMLMAKELGLSNYPSPAGGCVLTDPNYSVRFKFLKNLGRSLYMEDFELLRIGRHFDLPGGWRLVSSRNSEDGDRLMEHTKDRMVLFFHDCKGSYSTLVPPHGTDNKYILGLGMEDPLIKLSASIAARYSKAYNLGERSIPVLFTYNEEPVFQINAEPMDEAGILKYRI